MNVSRTRHPGLFRVSTARTALLIAGIVGLLSWVWLPVTGQDWPNCSDSQCVAGDLVVNSVSMDAGPCLGATRSGILKAQLSATSTRYNVRITAQVYTISSGTAGYLDTVNYCWPGAFTGTHTITLDSNVFWDCNASLELRYTLVSWQIQSDSYVCTSTLPCSAMTPKCNGDYYDQWIPVIGSEPLNAAPSGINSSVSMNEDGIYVFTVGDFGYTDDDGDPLAQIRISALEAVGDLRAGGADVTLNEVVTAGELAEGQLTYAPLPGQFGINYDSFRFFVHDGTTYSGSDSRMTIDVEPVNDPPVAIADAETANENQMSDLAVLANDSDPDGDPLALVSVTDPVHGTTEIVGALIRYTPDPFFVGFDSFTYTVSDPYGAEDSATVSVHVIHPNAAPIANAGGLYESDTRNPVTLDGKFSIDPDVSDILEYRWDVDGDGTWDTDWLQRSSVVHLYERPFLGRAILEVRDVYRGSPLGTSDQDDAYVRILPAPTQIAVSVYVDVNGNGEFDEEDVGLPGVQLLLDEETELLTGDDGTALSDDVAPGLHIVRISDEGVLYLRDRGFFLSEEALASVELESGDWVALFFAPEARGFLEVDLGADDNGSSG